VRQWRPDADRTAGENVDLHRFEERMVDDLFVRDGDRH
jgi:hypothetical protein